MTDSCPRCAELEARLADFERETFAELRGRVVTAEQHKDRLLQLEEQRLRIRDYLSALEDSCDVGGPKRILRAILLQEFPGEWLLSHSPDAIELSRQTLEHFRKHKR